MISKPRFLVRESDYHVWEVDESNGFYRSWSTRTCTYGDGTRPHAQSSMNYEDLTKIYGFFAIRENEVRRYEELNHLYYVWCDLKYKNDHHGGGHQDEDVPTFYVWLKLNNKI